MRGQAALLQWYVDAGADEAIDECPRDWFAAAAPAALTPATAPIIKISHSREGGNPGQDPRLRGGDNANGDGLNAAPHPLQTQAPRPASLASAIAEARKAADEATTLADLRQAVENFEGCAIKRTATHTVFADGNQAARLMLIGEAPGAQEDAKGIPFCGPSGQLLDKMLGAIGYDRTRAYITNTVFWRPPGNRQPNGEELAMCQPFVERHVALIDPALLVLVGGTATKAVLGTEQGITRLRGRRFTYRTPYRDKEYPVMIVYHPSYLLRQPAQKRATWQDLLAIKRELSVASGQWSVISGR